VRAHWGIENGLHWVLDIGFREDESRVRKDHAPENMAVLRHIALNLLKQEQTAKLGIKAKRLKAAWDQDYLLKVLSG
jgi:predicted transposase YbfD/YdcC